MRRMRLGSGIVMAIILLAGAFSVHAAEPDPFPGCAAPPAAPGPIPLAIGSVACQEVDASATLGGVTAFSYYVPPDCDPAIVPRRTCPVLTLLHGFGGSYTSETGTATAPSAEIRALVTRPAGDPYATKAPWKYANPGNWVAASPIDFIVVAPHGRTLAGGFGPAAGIDSFWTNWNPKYANRDHGNPDGVYDGPAPRFDDFVTRDLTAFVEDRFATAGHGREWRALQGTSLGGYGAYLLGLKHPDVWSSIGSISGAHNFLFVPWINPAPNAHPAIGIVPPVPPPYVDVPGPGPNVVHVDQLPSQLQGFGAAFDVFGDPAVDQAYFRGNMPRDLAMNARAYARGVQSLHIRGFSNDAIPRRLADIENPQSYASQQAFEAIVRPMNIDMELAFAAEKVQRTYELHPGLHSGTYWNPFLRAQLVAQYARVLHWDGGGSPPPQPAVFDYRSISRTFEVWGWTFDTDRPAVEFLTLRKVSCTALTLQGTGNVTVTVPASCGTGFDPDGVGPAHAAARFTIDLGNTYPIDEPLGLGALPYYGTTRTITLSPLAA